MSKRNIAYTEYTCDRCGDEWRDGTDEHRNSGFIQSAQDGAAAALGDMYSYHLCPTCAGALRTWLRDMNATVAV